MKTALSLLVIISAVALAGCGDSSPAGSSETGILTVSALRNSVPVADALVVLASPSRGGSVIAVATTDGDGAATLTELESGVYSLEVSKSVGAQLVYGVDSTVAVASGDSTDRTIVVDQESDDPFPLALGNTWTFSVGTDTTEIIGVFSTKMIGDLQTYTFGPDEGGHPPYVTRGVTDVYWHGWETSSGGDHILDSPAVFLDFAASEGESWSIPGWGSVVLEDTGVQVTVPAGTFDSCHRFRFTADAVPKVWWHAPGVGPVMVLDEDDVVWELLEYELH